MKQVTNEEKTHILCQEFLNSKVANNEKFKIYFSLYTLYRPPIWEAVLVKKNKIQLTEILI